MVSRRWNIFWVLGMVLGMFLLPRAADAQSLDPNCNPPNMLLVIDTSGSMADAGKIAALKAALEVVVGEFKKEFRLGLISFSGGKAQVRVPVGPDDPKDIETHAASMITATKALDALGDTPMTAAMREAKKHYLEVIPKDPIHQSAPPDAKRTSYVVLMTDGEPTDGDPEPEIAALRALQVGAKLYDVKTFVIGLGSGQSIRAAQLDQFAKTGGTNGFISAQAAGDLITAFRKALNDAKNKEECNGKDDDCDGKVDEDIQRDCQNACGRGKEICNNGQWSACDAPPVTDEICDGRDNNCNGKVDEDIQRDCATACGTGKQNCILGDWSTCSAPQPQTEECNNADDDCDGKIDEGTALCPNGACIQDGNDKRCKIPCSGGECPNGYVCNAASNECQERPCRKKDCPPGQVCEDTTGTAVCKDICKDVKCETGKTCGLSGQCVNCYKEKCPPKTICVNGQCITDHCATASCGTNQGCAVKDGQAVCFDTCANVTCKTGERCEKGICKKDACGSVACQGTGEVCVDDGKCITDKCNSTISTCAQHQVCDPKTGVCEDDPCLRTKCPAGVACYRGECGVNPPQGFCLTDDQCPEPKICKDNKCADLPCTSDADCVEKPGSICVESLCRTPPKVVGGCNCRSDASGSSAPSLVLFLLLGLSLLFRRRFFFASKL
ncbi:MAG: VWA domain-containing protein [Myxococcales bacterium]|nr:VWA domain-containing protein [Myxococcales bacterium]